jgi:NAD+ synthase (glutamine-hydrolysing)
MRHKGYYTPGAEIFHPPLPHFPPDPVSGRMGYMKPLRIALAQINTTVGDTAGNAGKILDYVARARESGAALVVFPELAIPGYPPEDLLLRVSFLEENLRAWKEIASRVKGITAVVGFVDRDKRGRNYNAAGIASGGRVRGVYHKMHLPNYGVFDEARYFSPGKKPMIFPAGRSAVGVTVCEDIWVRRGPLSREAKAGARLVLNLSSSPYHAGKWEERKEIVARHATVSRCPVAYCNLVGGQDELVFDGGSMVVSAGGNLLARGKMFEEDLLLCDVDGDGEGGRIDPAPNEDEEIFRALVVGTRDYVEKNRFPGLIIGLSGGIDSSLVAVIAVEALGTERVLGVTMSSPYTAKMSVEDSHRLAANLGIRCTDLSIGEIFRAFGSELAETFRGHSPDTTEENIQARIRGTILMALSNKFVLQPQARPRRHPGAGAHEAPVGGACTRPEGYGLPSRVRCPRPDPADVRREGQEHPGDGRGGVSRGGRPSHRVSRRHERVQAAPGSAGGQDHPSGTGQGPPHADHQPVEPVTWAGTLTPGTFLIHLRNAGEECPRTSGMSLVNPGGGTGSRKDPSLCNAEGPESSDSERMRVARAAGGRIR